MIHLKKSYENIGLEVITKLRKRGDSKCAVVGRFESK